MRRLIPLATVTALAAGALVAPAAANQDVLTFLHIKRSFPTFHGTIDSREKGCVKGRTVKLLGEAKARGRQGPRPRRGDGQRPLEGDCRCRLGLLLRKGAAPAEPLARPRLQGRGLARADRRLKPERGLAPLGEAEDAAGVVEALDQAIDLLGRRVDAEAGARRCGDPEPLHERLRAVVSGADRPRRGGRGSPRRRARARRRARRRPARVARATAAGRTRAGRGPRRGARACAP